MITFYAPLKFYVPIKHVLMTGSYVLSFLTAFTSTMTASLSF